MAEQTDSIWYYADSGQQVGPFTAEQVKQFVETGRVSPETPVWKSGMAEWLAISAIPELAVVKVAAPPPTTTAPPKDRTPEPFESDRPSGGLKLGGAKEFDKINLKEEDPAGAVDIQEMLSEGGEDGQSAKSISAQSKLLSKPKVGFFESIGLGSFESAFFAVMLVLAGIGSVIKMEYWHAIVMGAGVLMVLAGQIAWLVRAFMKHWAWGIAVFLLSPLAALIYLVVDLKNAGKSFVLVVVGIAAIITPTTFSSFATSPIADPYNEIMGQYQDFIENYQQEIEQSRQEKEDRLPQ
ncbi:MAG: DUF4339 domain-containing protein [Verrucomicrobiota bacterium]